MLKPALLFAAALCASFAATTAKAGGNTFVVTVLTFQNWTVDGQSDPTLTLTRGETYVFDLQGVNGIHPFFIKTASSTGAGDQFNDGVTNNGAVGETDITFVVPLTAPSQLFYNCGTHAAMAGVIEVIDAPPVFRDGFEDPL
jgi:hypothetical protein